MEDRPESLFLSLPAAAREMGIGIERLKRAVRLHQIAAVAIGARTMIPRAAIEKLATPNFLPELPKLREKESA
jgi:hypothetical protein